ncbi:unnamed protein product [Lathyrus oleraceus]
MYQTAQVSPLEFRLILLPLWFAYNLMRNVSLLKTIVSDSLRVKCFCSKSNFCRIVEGPRRWFLEVSVKED